jgi:phospholipase C
MARTSVVTKWLRNATSGLLLVALSWTSTPASGQNNGLDPDRQRTATPIKHVIVLIGENRTFDHIFATYVPRGRRESVRNLLSEGIITPMARRAGISQKRHNSRRCRRSRRSISSA